MSCADDDCVEKRAEGGGTIVCAYDIIFVDVYMKIKKKKKSIICSATFEYFT